MNTGQLFMTVSQAVDLALQLNSLITKAQASGKNTVDLTHLQKAFADLNAAESALDAAIDEAE